MSYSDEVIYSYQRDLPLEQVLRLYVLRDSDYLDQGNELYKALMASHSLVSAWCRGRLIGLGNAISDGYLFVYYPHLLVDPTYRGRGIGRGILLRLMANYHKCQQGIAVVEPHRVSFYERCGFSQQDPGQVLLFGPAPHVESV